MLQKSSQAPLFSIVLPTYGVEPYIAQVLTCLQNQTYSDFEVLVVDDASPDQSAAIAQHFADQDARIRIIHHADNQGLSAARNSGISFAKGCYITFFDPDDTYEPQLLEKVAESLDRQCAQIVLFGHTEDTCNEAGEITQSLAYPVPVLPLIESPATSASSHSANNTDRADNADKSTNSAVVTEASSECAEGHEYPTPEAFHSMVLTWEKNIHYGYAWNKFYDLAFIKEYRLKFKNNPLIEDLEFNVEAFSCAQTVNVVSEPLYHYAKREQGNLTNKFEPRYFELHQRRIQLLVDQQKAWGLWNDESRAALGSLYARYIISALERNNDPRAHMLGSDKKAFVGTLYESKLFNELIPYAQASSPFLNAAYRPLKRKSIAGALAIGKTVHTAKQSASGVLQKIKAKR